jgi:hypothetical protein
MGHKYGWQGKTVRNADARTGVIAIENGFGPYLDLHIECSDGTRAKVKLNARGRDSGEAGWQWWCPEFDGIDGKAAWLPLGEHGAPLAYAEIPNARTQPNACRSEAEASGTVGVH